MPVYQQLHQIDLNNALLIDVSCIYQAIIFYLSGCIYGSERLFTIPVKRFDHDIDTINSRKKILYNKTTTLCFILAKFTLN